jgi:superfamily II DNA/RNA helicase
MDLDERAKAQQIFSRDVRVLISTDAGGEGLNLQFCHVVVNFDMPWNPMKVEQRIGRVDRIGQHHVVRAINFVLQDTVEHRVRQVLEEKLEIIAQEFGVDKASDVMDSVESEPIFDELFVHGLQDPGSIEQECEAVIEKVRSKVGLPTVRQHRRTRLDAEYQSRVGVLESAESSVPDLNAVMMLRINSEETENGSHQGVRAG